MLGFLIGVFVGGTFSVIIMSLMAAGKSDKQIHH